MANAKNDPKVVQEKSRCNEFKLDLVFIFFTCLTFVLALIPQSGYIHPDEFFQSVEVTAGDIFDFKVNRPWEFDSRFPIRSIVLPYITTGPPYLLLRLLSNWAWTENIASVTPYTLLVLPRVVFAVLHIICCVYIGRLARALGFTGRIVQCAYVSSYVALVFYSRTFSNTLESFLFVILLYVTRRNLYGRGDAGAFTITFLIVAGIFNRPTFAFYAFVPFLYWLFSVDIKPFPTRRNRFSICQVIFKLICCSVYAFGMVGLFVFCDTVYFKRKTLEELVDAFIRSKSAYSFICKEIAITPMNFMIYNTDSNNLSEHGLHPRITHMLVNIPLLFGPLGVFVFVELYISIRRFIMGTALPPRMFLLLSFYSPLLLLSVFPHQEPRFLLPLLAPLCILYGFQIFGPKASDWLGCTWITFTAIGVAFYGFIHQGRVIPAITQLSNQFNNTTAAAQRPDTNHVIFFHTYMPPYYLFKMDQGSNIALTDLKGSSIETLSLTVKNIQIDACKTKYCTVYIVLPKTLSHLIGRVEKDTGIPLILYQSLFPHFTGEDLPNFQSVFQNSKTSCLKLDEHAGYICALKQFISKILDYAELEIYEVLLNAGHGKSLKGTFKS